MEKEFCYVFLTDIKSKQQQIFEPIPIVGAKELFSNRTNLEKAVLIILWAVSKLVLKP